MKLETSPDGTIRWVHELPPHQILTLLAENLRRERTGLHALIAILLNDQILGHDVFNIGRSEERARLSKNAYAQMSGLALGEYREADLRHDLDTFALSLDRAWAGRFTVEAVEGKRRLEGQTYVLKPWVLTGGGTILFAPPKSGKSYMALLMAQSIHTGCDSLWPVQQQPVVFVNLERSRLSLEHRLACVNGVLGLPERTPIPMLNARGQTLSSIATALKGKGTPQVGILDSISRVGAGSMVSDDVANAIVDMLNGLFPSWLAVGHTPRGGDHIYGSVHFEAGQDLGVLVKSHQRDNTLGLMLKATPANDIPPPPPVYYSLEFAEEGDVSGLAHVEEAKKADWPEIALEEAMGTVDRILTWVEDQGRATSTEVAEALHLDVANVSRTFHKSGRFEPAGREGRQVYYQVKKANAPAPPWER